jgi:hypothetical protein
VAPRAHALPGCPTVASLTVMTGFRRFALWLVFLAFSAVLHAIVSGRVGHQIQHRGGPPPVEEEIEIALVQEPQKLVEREPPPEEQLEFEEELELDPPEILIAPKAVAPPPPDVTVALRAQAGGSGGDENTEGAPQIEIAGGLSLGAIPGTGGSGFGGFKSGIGNGLGDGTSRFAAYIAGLREAGLDVVFVIDATGSMDWVIEEVKDRIEDIAQIVRSLVPIARFGFVAYRDDDDPEFTTRVQPLTYSTGKLNRYLRALEAKGGGDWFEAIDEGLADAIEESGWRMGARKLIIVIGDAPMREGQLDRVIRLVSNFQHRGGTVSTLDVSDQANPHLLEAKIGREVSRDLYRNAPMQEFLMIGEAGHGDTATLDGDTKLTKRLIRLIMGDQFAAEMQALLDVL